MAIRWIPTELDPQKMIASPTLEAVRHKEGKAVDVAVLVDGVEVDRFQLEPRRFWMERRAIALPQSGGDARGAEVVFRITSDDNAWRETVLEADLLATLPDSLRAWATQVIE